MASVILFNITLTFAGESVVCSYLSRGVYLSVYLYLCHFLNGCCQWGLIEGGYVSEAFELYKVHCRERLAYLPYRECALVLFLHDSQDEQGNEADEEVGCDALRGPNIYWAHVEVRFFNLEALFYFPAP